MIVKHYKVEVYLFQDDFESNGLLAKRPCNTYSDVEHLLDRIDFLSNQLSFRYEFTVEKVFEEVSDNA